MTLTARQVEQLTASMGVGDVVVTDADLTKLDLEGRHFSGCTFVDCVFDGMLLAYWRLYSCKFERCSFLGADMAPVDEAVNCEFVDCDFTSALMNGSEFIDCRFERCAFRGVDVSTVELVECEVVDTPFDDAEGTFRYATFVDGSGPRTAA